MREPGLWAGLLLFFWFYYTKLTITKNRFLDIYLVFVFIWLGRFFGVGGLTGFWGRSERQRRTQRARRCAEVAAVRPIRQAQGRLWGTRVVGGVRVLGWWGLVCLCGLWGLLRVGWCRSARCCRRRWFGGRCLRCRWPMRLRCRGCGCRGGWRWCGIAGWSIGLGLGG
jgi:hypothetical protein